MALSRPAMLGRWFSRAELECRCGCGLVPPVWFVERLDELRGMYGAPLVVTSGARCAEYNSRVSSTGRDGPHTIAAVDVRIAGQAAAELVGLALHSGWTGFGVRQHGARGARFVHLDRLPAGGTHPRPRIWSYP